MLYFSACTLCAFKLNFERLQNGMTEPGGDVAGGLYLLLGVPKSGNEARLSTTALHYVSEPCRAIPNRAGLPHFAGLARCGTARYGTRLHRENFRAVSCRTVPYRERELV